MKSITKQIYNSIFICNQWVMTYGRVELSNKVFEKQYNNATASNSTKLLPEW